MKTTKSIRKKIMVCVVFFLTWIAIVLLWKITNPLYLSVSVLIFILEILSILSMVGNLINTRITPYAIELISAVWGYAPFMCEINNLNVLRLCIATSLFVIVCIVFHRKNPTQ